MDTRTTIIQSFLSFCPQDAAAKPLLVCDLLSDELFDEVSILYWMLFVGQLLASLLALSISVFCHLANITTFRRHTATLVSQKSLRPLNLSRLVCCSVFIHICGA